MTPKTMNFGCVRVTTGKHTGRAGYYDDDAHNGYAVVYWGAPCLSDYSLIQKKNLIKIDALEAAKLGWKFKISA